jgi:hypothetical protein
MDTWRVCGRKLEGRDTQLSKVMRVGGDGHSEDMEFVLSIKPKRASEARGGASFKAAKGVGSLQVKCNSLLDGDLPVYLAVGGDVPGLSVVHNFADSPIVKFPGEINFKDLIDRGQDFPYVTISFGAKRMALERSGSGIIAPSAPCEDSSTHGASTPVWTPRASAEWSSQPEAPWLTDSAWATPSMMSMVPTFFVFKIRKADGVGVGLSIDRSDDEQRHHHGCRA